jgi:site-specific DNA-cytosine methylase
MRWGMRFFEDPAQGRDSSIHVYVLRHDPVARQVAQFRVENLSAKYPDLFPPTAWADAFDLPQDITKVTEQHLDQSGLFKTGQPWLITAGWPGQDYSSAGLGALEQRATLLHDVARLIKMVQMRHRDNPPGYILENVAMQRNFRHDHIKFPVYEQIVAQLGKPGTFDAAQAGSYAHRLRNYWTIWSIRSTSRQSWIRSKSHEIG